MARRTITPHEIHTLLTHTPSRDETLALVGYLALCNAFGPVVRDEVGCQKLTPKATRWVGELMAVAGRGQRRYYAPEQSVTPNRKRSVRVRKAKGMLA